MTCRVLVLVLLAACGGGGGGGAPVQPSEPTRLLASDLELGPTVTQGDLLVRLSTVAEPAPVLLQVAIELPPQLTLPASERLLAARPLPTLEGDFKGGRFVVMCGDATNANAAPLQTGDLFRLRLQPTLPRQPGSYVVQLRQVRAASRDGVEVAAEPTVVAATVIVR